MDRLRNRRFRSKKFLKVPDPAAMRHSSAQILIGMVFWINTMIADEILFQRRDKSPESPGAQCLLHLFNIESRMIGLAVKDRRQPQRSAGWKPIQYSCHRLPPTGPAMSTRAASMFGNQ